MDDDVTARIIGMMAVEKRLMTEKQLRECLNTFEFFNEGPLIELFVSKNFLTSRQIARLRQIVERGDIEPESDPSADWLRERFGEIAATRYGVDSEEILSCLGEQKNLAETGFRCPLGQLLMSRGVLGPSQVTEILALQGRRILRCAECDARFTVVDFDPAKFYECRKCPKADLVETEIVPISREKIERRLRLIDNPLPSDPIPDFDFDEEDDQTDDEAPPGLKILEL
jgi:hypothetical protein